MILPKRLRVVLSGMVLLAASRMAAQVPLPEDAFPGLATYIESAQAQAPAVLKQALSAESSELQVDIARAARLPSVGAAFQYFVQQESRQDRSGSSTLGKQYYSLTISQPVWHWGVLQRSQAMAKIQAAIAQTQLADTRALVAAEVRRQYLALVLANQDVKLAELSVERSRETMKLVLSKIEVGELSPGADFEPRQSLENDLINAERAAWGMQRDLRAFARLTGRPAPSLESLPAEVELPPEMLTGNSASPDAWHDVAAWDIKQKELDRARLDYRNSRYALYPKLSIQAGISQDERNDTANIADRYSYAANYIGVAVNWPIFDGLASRARRHLAANQVKQLESDQTALQQKLADDLAAAEFEVNLAWRTAERARNYRDGAISGLKIAERRAEVGELSSDEVAAYRRNYLDSRQQSSRAAFGWYQAVAAWQYAQGQ